MQSSRGISNVPARHSRGLMCSSLLFGRHVLHSRIPIENLFFITRHPARWSLSCIKHCSMYHSVPLQDTKQRVSGRHSLTTHHTRVVSIYIITAICNPRASATSYLLVIHVVPSCASLLFSGRAALSYTAVIDLHRSHSRFNACFDIGYLTVPAVLVESYCGYKAARHLHNSLYPQQHNTHPEQRSESCGAIEVRCTHSGRFPACIVAGNVSQPSSTFPSRRQITAKKENYVHPTPLQPLFGKAQ